MQMNEKWINLLCIIIPVARSRLYTLFFRFSMPVANPYMWGEFYSKSLTPELYSHQTGQASEIAFVYWDTKNNDVNNDTSIKTDIFITT